MEDCKCNEILEEINKVSSDWNLGEACRMWGERKGSLENNNIQFEAYSDECYACTCPSCGKIVCGWCV